MFRVGDNRTINNDISSHLEDDSIVSNIFPASKMRNKSSRMNVAKYCIIMLLMLFVNCLLCNGVWLGSREGNHNNLSFLVYHISEALGTRNGSRMASENENMNIKQEVSEVIYGNSQNIAIRKQQDDDTLINSSNTSMPIYTVEEIKDYNDNKTDNEMIIYELEENVNISSANIFPKNFKLTKISNQNAVAEELKLTKISNENNEVDPMFSGIVDVYFSNVSYCAQYDKEEHEGLKKELSNKNCKLVFEDNKNKYEFQSNNNEAYILALVTLGNGVYNYDYGDNADAQTTYENQEGNKWWVYCKNANSIKKCHDSNAYRGLFYGSEAIKIEIINSGNNIKNMNKMFYRCTSLTSLNLSNLKTSNVTNMEYMFYNCNKLKKLNLKSFTTLKVIDMNNMFYGCTSLIELDLSSFNTTNVTDMSYMFYNCSSLIELNLSRFRTENVNMKNMFENCFQENTDVVLRCPKKDILDHIKSNYNSITIKHAEGI